MLLKIKNFIKSNLFKYISANFIGVILNFLISSYILVKLGAEELGIFTFFMILIGLFSSLSQGAANSYLMKNFFVQDKNKTISSVNVTMLFFSVFSILTYIILLELEFSNYFYVDYFIIFAILKAFNSTPFVVMRLYNDATAFFVLSILYKSLYGIIALLFIIINNFNIKKLINILFINELIFFGVLYSLLFVKYKYKFVLDFSYIKANIFLSLKLFPHKVFKTIYENVDKYAIQFFIGSEALGVYSMIMRLVSPIAIFIKAVINEITVIMSKIYGGKEKIKVLISVEKKVLVLLIFVNITTIMLALMYNNYIYNFGNYFYKLLILGVLLNNNLYFYFIFYNNLFLKNKKIIYYIMGINLLIFSILLFFISHRLVYILLLYLSINLYSNIVLFLLDKERLFLSDKLFVYFILLVLMLIGGFVL